MYKKIITISSVLTTIMFLTPGVVLAKLPFSDFPGLVKTIIDFITPISAIIVLIIILLFFWNIFKIGQESGPEATKQAKTKIIAGLATLFILISIWGLTITVIGFLG